MSEHALNCKTVMWQGQAQFSLALSLLIAGEPV